MALINLRNALMGGKRLPYDAEVECLASTGTQWIDTGVLANGEFDVEYTIQTPSTFNRNFIVGGARSSTQHLNFGQYESDGKFILAYLGNYWTALQSISANTIYTTKVHYASGSQTATVNGGSVLGQTYTGTEALNLNIYLFRRNFYGATDAVLQMIGRMYSFKIYQNGVLVRDFIPVRKGTVGYLYDRVTGKLFGNAGTGDFVVGQDVVPVEYIESHGTEWFEAGFDITNAQSFAYDIKFDLAQTITNAQPRLMSNEGAGAGNYYDIYYASNTLRIRQANAVIDNVLSDVPIVARMTEQGRYYGYYESSPESLLWDVTRAFTAPTVQMKYKIFDRANNGQEQYRWQGKAYYMHFTKDGAPVRKFAPVRVGTDATSWEGAMMDVLTRRIYRNQGTGAFTYGNDLKYPIPAE